jgi:hypothetical protein
MARISEGSKASEGPKPEKVAKSFPLIFLPQGREPEAHGACDPFSQVLNPAFLQGFSAGPRTKPLFAGAQPVNESK